MLISFMQYGRLSKRVSEPISLSAKANIRQLKWNWINFFFYKILIESNKKNDCRVIIRANCYTTQIMIRLWNINFTHQYDSFFYIFNAYWITLYNLCFLGKDVIGISNTSSGKTGAFVLPILHALALQPCTP